jgi:hypothetical protein
LLLFSFSYDKIFMEFFSASALLQSVLKSKNSYFSTFFYKLFKSVTLGYGCVNLYDKIMNFI